MVINTANCNWSGYLQFDRYYDSVSKDWVETVGGYAGTNILGYIIDNYGAYRATCLKFTPIFSKNGVSEYINFSYRNGSTTSDNIPIRYVLCDSDANKDMYESYGVVYDEHQIASGEIVFLRTAGYSDGNPSNDIEPPSYEETINEITIYTDKLISGQTYYLFLCPGPSDLSEDNDYYCVSVEAIGEITVGYHKNLVYIDTGSELSRYQCYIDNGTTWKLYAPYIDNGTSWEEL